MLTINNLTKKYGKVIAVDDVSLNIIPGEISILLGPNGAGKSTMLKSIAGLLKYEGEIKVFDYSNKSIDAKKILGFVPETPSLYDMLTVREHLEFIARAYKIDGYDEKIDVLLQRFDLADKQEKLGRDLSKGMCQKVNICCALLIEPKVILFDEPMIGLDPMGIRELKKVFEELKSNETCIFISTHIIDSIEDVWDAAYIMHHGRIMEHLIKDDEKMTGKTLEDLFFSVTGQEEEQA